MAESGNGPENGETNVREVQSSTAKVEVNTAPYTTPVTTPGTTDAPVPVTSIDRIEEQANLGELGTLASEHEKTLIDTDLDLEKDDIVALELNDDSLLEDTTEFKHVTIIPQPFTGSAANSFFASGDENLAASIEASSEVYFDTSKEDTDEEAKWDGLRTKFETTKKAITENEVNSIDSKEF